MRALEKIVPLRPALDDVALGVDHHDAILPARVDAVLAFPVFRGVFGQITGGATAREARDGPLRSVAKRHFAGREREAGTNLRQRRVLRAHQRGQLATLRDVDAVGALGEDAFHGAPGPFFVSWKRAQRLGPIRVGIVRPGHVLAALFSGNRGKSGDRSGLCLRLRGFDAAGQQRAGREGECGNSED